MSIEAFFLQLFREEPWRKDATCVKERVPTSTFFLERGQSKKRAKEVCARCPVSAACEDYANREHIQHGIWNGKIRKATDSKEVGAA